MNVSAEDRAPSLAGRQGADRMPRPRAPWWIHLCAASFLGYFGLVMFSTFYPPAGVGVRIGTTRTDGLIVASVIAGFEADRAGVQPGDRLVAINGRRLRNLREYCARSAPVSSVGEERTWLFERSGPSILRSRSRLIAVSSLPISVFCRVCLGLLASLVFSFVVIYSRPEDRVARLGALLLASMACALAPTWPTGPRRDLASLAGPRRCAAVACLPERGLGRPDHRSAFSRCFREASSAAGGSGSPRSRRELLSPRGSGTI